MAQQHHDPPRHLSKGANGRQDVLAETRTRSADVGAVAACVGQKRRSVATHTTRAASRQSAASDGRIQLRPPVLLPLSAEHEDRAVGLLAELIGARLARSSLDLISVPVNGLLDPRPATGAAEPPSPAV
jgi:hypothetical protein